MYQIGLFSKMNRVTTKTLRHYDALGLLKPDHVDEFTGYRYYSGRQIPRLNMIIALKQMGFSLSEIQMVIDDPLKVDFLLDLKQNELNDKINKANAQLLKVINYRQRLRGEKTMKYNPIIKTLPEVIVASMRIKTQSYGEFFYVIPQMGKEMEKAGAVCASPMYCFNIYHDNEYKESDIDVEICEAVVDYCKDSEKVKYKKIDQVDRAVCVVHKGSYDLLREAYTFIYQWIKDNKYKIIGQPRESYIDGIWNQEYKENWVTEIQIPITTE